MGYDMFMRAKPAGYAPGYQPQFAEDPEYWRFNSGGMRGMYRIMSQAGVLDEATIAPTFPEFPTSLFSEVRAEELDQWIVFDETPEVPASREELEAVGPYRAEIEKVQSTRASGTLVAGFKFRSNDGWLVTPEECLILASGLRSALSRVLPDPQESGISREEAAEWILNWAAYNETAAVNGGYRVK